MKTDNPSAAEQAAQQWHDEQVVTDPEHEQYSTCWCCCTSCDPDYRPGKVNPHFAAASVALKAARTS